MFQRIFFFLWLGAQAHSCPYCHKTTRGKSASHSHAHQASLLQADRTSHEPLPVSLSVDDVIKEASKTLQKRDSAEQELQEKQEREINDFTKEANKLRSEIVNSQEVGEENMKRLHEMMPT
eukprot:Blabericola_migrator_1__754@NODE_1188_length_5170_cov_116_229277_g554_i1_p2_GENE_NODE_1188_length_5170_cov_116_229277_g554_i1NODE_1188_length_5170_cov_116_229277_g554_i1_p2_ORF_typecomplete_len121_score6_79Cauli_AT/PF03233_13/0_026FAM76/PF16046_5/0_079Macoilin/PF09726_9/0_12Cast/PF10174_9/0_28Syntaxin18_N/PF10496_9/0_6LCD1/PF09798_9/0_54Nup88/PF10168_9/0_46DUF2570/PF10828_8/16_NODE_1188_length_5170_cov_116_229277_g554_i1634996